MAHLMTYGKPLTFNTFCFCSQAVTDTTCIAIRTIQYAFQGLGFTTLSSSSTQVRITENADITHEPHNMNHII